LRFVKRGDVFIFDKNFIEKFERGLLKKSPQTVEKAM
jgi:hypothetical protein